MDITEITKLVFKNPIVGSIIIIIVSYILYLLINNTIFKGKGIFKFSIGSSSKTYMQMIKNGIKYAFIILTTLIVLQINGVNVTSLLAGIGILSVIIGLALKDALQDIIKGFTILSDSYFKVGDVIKYKNIEGKVLIIGLKTTKIKDITNQNVIAIANRNIEQVEVVSNQLDINIPIGYNIKKEKANNAIEEIIKQITTLESVKECKYIGINKFADSNLDYLIRIQCNPETKYQTKRDAQIIIFDILNKHHIEIPYKQIDIHTK